ncbi:unnamed protein product, partial [Sphagnum balticum]
MAMVSIAHQAAAALRCNASSNSHGVVRGGTGSIQLHLANSAANQCHHQSLDIPYQGRQFYHYHLKHELWINGSRLPFCQRQSILTISATFSGE